ncbi:MAG: T9SS type A sorting domain-containing protein [Bacteroidota bacterium]|nr:T9SS type A sorting domain-containing protein [Bacteroidota bacterium]
MHSLQAQVLSLSQSPGTISTANNPAYKSTWVNPSNVSAADNIYTTASVTNRKHSNTLVATNWGFSLGNGAGQIPSNAVINGILVEIKMKGSSKGVRDYIIQLQKSSSTTSNNLARLNTAWPKTLSYIKFGSTTNMWGLTWTPAEIASPTFGVQIAVQGKTTPGTAMIDHIRITVYFNLRFYYSKSAGNLTSLITWGTNADGSGPNPLNFTDYGQIFTLQNRTSATLDANMTIAGQASKLIVGNGAIATALTLPSTASLNSLVDVSSYSTLNISNTVSPTIGSLDDNSTVAYNANADQIVDEVTFYHLLLGGTGTKTSEVAGTSITVNGDFTINTGISFINNDQDLIVNGNFINSGTVTGTSFIWMNGITASTISGTGIISNLNTDNDIGVTLNAAQNVTDTLYLNSTTFTNSTFLTMSAGSIIIRDDGGALSAMPAGSNLYNVQYLGSTKTAGPEISGSYINNMQVSLVDTLPNILNLSQAIIINGDLKIDSGKLDVTTSNYNISIAKNFMVNGSFDARSNTVTLNGSALQTISGTGIISFYKLSENNAAGLLLQSPISISYLLTFTNGIITTDNVNKITMGSAATTTGASSTRYINGPLSKTLASTSLISFVYPVGSSNLYRPVTLDITQSSSTATTYTVEMINSAPPSATLPGTLTRVSSYRYYKLSKGAGANINTGAITLNYGPEDNIILPANTRIAERSGSNWINLGGIGNTIPSGSIKSTVNFTTLNDFVLADNTVALPLGVISFKAILSNSIVKLAWVINNLSIDHFEIEKSLTAAGWINLGNVQANIYTFLDKNPYTGKSYYRLKVIDKSGAVSYSDVISLFNSNAAVPKVSMFPNLINKAQQSTVCVNGFTFDQNENVAIKIFNSNGSLLQNQIYKAAEQLPLNLYNLPSGMYIMVAEIKGSKYSSSFIVR